MARIRYSEPDEIEDPALRAELERAMLHSTPRPEIQAIRARQPEVLRAFLSSWSALFREGIVDLSVKELCRLRVAQTLDCDY